MSTGQSFPRIPHEHPWDLSLHFLACRRSFPASSSSITARESWVVRQRLTARGVQDPPQRGQAGRRVWWNDGMWDAPSVAAPLLFGLPDMRLLLRADAVPWDTHRREEDRRWQRGPLHSKAIRRKRSPPEVWAEDAALERWDTRKEIARQSHPPHGLAKREHSWSLTHPLYAKTSTHAWDRGLPASQGLRKEVGTHGSLHQSWTACFDRCRVASEYHRIANRSRDGGRGRSHLQPRLRCE